jgi:hypothetical protein
VQGDGKVVIAGSSGDNLVQHFSLVRLNADGSRDSSFGLLGNGIVTTDLYGLRSYGFALAASSTDGKIVIAGGTYFALGEAGDIGVARYLP